MSFDTTRHPGYAGSQRTLNRIEGAFGWIRTHASSILRFAVMSTGEHSQYPREFGAADGVCVTQMWMLPGSARLSRRAAILTPVPNTSLTLLTTSPILAWIVSR
jgi:hypothetical protein